MLIISKNFVSAYSKVYFIKNLLVLTASKSAMTNKNRCTRYCTERLKTACIDGKIYSWTLEFQLRR